MIDLSSEYCTCVCMCAVLCRLVCPRFPYLIGRQQANCVGSCALLPRRRWRRMIDCRYGIIQASLAHIPLSLSSLFTYTVLIYLSNLSRILFHLRSWTIIEIELRSIYIWWSIQLYLGFVCETLGVYHNRPYRHLIVRLSKVITHWYSWKATWHVMNSLFPLYVCVF